MSQIITENFTDIVEKFEIHCDWVEGCDQKAKFLIIYIDYEGNIVEDFECTEHKELIWSSRFSYLPKGFYGYPYSLQLFEVIEKIELL